MQEPRKKVRFMVNAKSGTRWSFDALRRAVDESWESAGHVVSYQFSQSTEDGVEKARQAVADGIDIIMVAGGDGTVNTVARELIGSPVVLGIVPVGSGNGFARHFGIPLVPRKAVAALADAFVKPVDVGMVNETPFFVTCSMAWDASIAEAFARSPVRGILPYVLAGVQQFFDYIPQDVRVDIDDKESLFFAEPIIFTVANISQFGGGAIIAPQAKADDGWLELVVALRRDAAMLLANLPRLFNGTLHQIPEVTTRHFRKLKITRPHATPLQIDGELVQADANVRVRVHEQRLRVLVPNKNMSGKPLEP